MRESADLFIIAIFCALGWSYYSAQRAILKELRELIRLGRIEIKRELRAKRAGGS
ncbi:MAG: hypothetical protein ACLPWF_04645 [Bryobacteraceae bacterium]|jgi:hypothetical protein